MKICCYSYHPTQLSQHASAVLYNSKFMVSYISVSMIFFIINCNTVISSLGLNMAEDCILRDNLKAKGKLKKKKLKWKAIKSTKLLALPR